jgi:UDP-N-acetyl-D-glucosamine dehydrogenase
MAENFGSRIDARQLTVGVIGLGYVGLPLAMAFAEAGFRTVGYDVDESKVERLNAGLSHIEDVTAERVSAAVAAGRFRAGCEAGTLEGADAVFISVPTPFDEAKTPDLAFVRSATETLAAHLHPGMLVVLQSTTFPGTTTEVVQPILERSGLWAGVDFHLAFSPERVDPGNVTWTVRNTPKVVGGVTPACADEARLLLESVMDAPGEVTVVSSPAAAEMAKLLENTYRAVNIALVNELAVLAHEMGIDMWEVIGAAATKPFGFTAFSPGVGPGGHCIPVDPYYLSWRARVFDFQAKFIELAADTNLRMAPYVQARVGAFLNRLGRPLRGSRVLALGATFKPGVSDVRNSRAIRVIELLEQSGAVVDFSDPRVDSLALAGGERKSVPLTEYVVGDHDIVVILVGHPEWPLDMIVSSGVPVFDAVGATVGRPEGAVLERL